ncbi:uncharacterized protein Nmag_3183 [Natrialba magadii ATCC 43099]|uniref:Uncharacterized protein n=1 Tax=Natrialba magadii (strain ATCC 43099 / DSM 3394 / CCM 3739 / CIP 104546 / IAM 13178 / JCM 8861 / NBRC 102185 / NCIMB 2190 / MS3) TaxID=547559 RepID=D3SRW0_NATMM|nr:hypothetical protein [Natrialba magadii]ADD06734.1 uncharacterized protein Nmag_3183 [Natrialba magadii ATCC 43099]
MNLAIKETAVFGIWLIGIVLFLYGFAILGNILTGGGTPLWFSTSLIITGALLLYFFDNIKDQI